MKCKKCGAEISEETKFCGSCGASIVNSEIETSESKVEDTATTNTVIVSEKKNNVFKKFINNKRLMLAAGVVLAVIIVIVGVLTFINKSPKQIFNKSIDQLFKTVENNTEQLTSKQVSGKTNVKMEMTGLGEIGEIVNKLALDFNYEVDYDKKIMNMQLKPTYGKDAIIDFNGHFKNDEAYMYLNDVFDKYIKLPMDKEQAKEIFSNNGSNDAKVMLKEMKNEFKNSLSSKYFTKEKVEIKVDGEYTKVTKSTMTLTDKNYQEFMEQFTTNLKENDKFIEAYAKVSGESKTDVKKQLSDNNTNSADMMDQKLTISIYTEGLFNNFKGVVIGIQSSTQKYSIDLLKVTKDNYEYKLQNGSTIVARGNIKVEEKNDNQVVTLTINVGIINVKLIVTNNIKKDVKIDEKKISNSIEADKLTLEEQTKINDKLMSSSGMKAIMTEINNLMGGYNYGY